MRRALLPFLCIAWSAAWASPDEYQEGKRFLQQKAYRQAATHFERAAAEGSAAAERELALMIYQGLGFARDDARAVAMLENAASRGDKVAQVDLASLYENGLSAPQDDARSAKWWLAAAEQGDARAQFRIGEILWLGQGMPRDRPEALKWWVLAREQGEAEWMRATIAGVRDPIPEGDWDAARERAREWHARREAAQR